MVEWRGMCVCKARERLGSTAVSKDRQGGGPHRTITMSQGPTTTTTGTRPPQDKRPTDDDKEGPHWTTTATRPPQDKWPTDNDNDNVGRDDMAPPPDNDRDVASAGQMAHGRRRQWQCGEVGQQGPISQQGCGLRRTNGPWTTTTPLITLRWTYSACSLKCRS